MPDWVENPTSEEVLDDGSWRDIVSDLSELGKGELLGELNRGGAFLDIGCGGGELVAYLRKRQGIRAFGIDRELRVPIASQKGPDGARWFFHGDARLRLPFDDGTIAMVYSRAIFDHYLFRDQEGIYLEVRRVLMTGGVYYVVDWDAPDFRTIEGFQVLPWKGQHPDYSVLEKVE